MILHGRNMMVLVGGEAIAAAKSCDISVHCEEIETSTPQTGIWRTAILGRKSWQVTCGQLVTSIVRPISMVGTTVSLSREVADTGRIFHGFVDNVDIQPNPLSSSPMNIVWDKTRKIFLAKKLNSYHSWVYYDEWPNDELYTNPSDYDYFQIDITYSWINGELIPEKLTGQANVVEWRGTGAVGNLCQGSFRFNGNGALTPAALPST